MRSIDVTETRDTKCDAKKPRKTLADNLQTSQMMLVRLEKKPSGAYQFKELFKPTKTVSRVYILIGLREFISDQTYEDIIRYCRVPRWETS